MRRHAARLRSPVAHSRPPLAAARTGAGTAWSLSGVPAHPRAPSIQPKLTVGAANDPAEAEADRVADRVMRTAGAEPAIRTGAGLRRKCAACEDEPVRLQAAGPAVGSPAGPAAEAAVQGLGSGSALPRSERDFFEPRLGADLSGVRIHAGADADLASRALGARAFTLARDVAFAAGEYRPGTGEGRRLLAHELAHVVQQGAGGRTVRRIPGDRQPGGRGRGDPLPYREATDLADCIRIMGPNSEPYCHQTVLGEAIPDVVYGTMAVNMAPVLGGAEGTVVFRPRLAGCPRCNTIRLIQIVRVTAGGGTDYSWQGAEANRDLVKTAADPLQGIAPNYFVDHQAGSCAAGTPCSVYYRDHWPNASDSQDGSCDGTTARDASLWDGPNGPANFAMDFETCARCADNGAYFGCINWGFTLDAARAATLTPTAEHRHPSATFRAATRRFDQFYGNP